MLQPGLPLLCKVMPSLSPEHKIEFPEYGVDRWWSVQQPQVICSQLFRPVYSVKSSTEYIWFNLLRENGAWREPFDVDHCK